MKPRLQDLGAAVSACAMRLGVELSGRQLEQLVGHAADVLDAEPSLHLTAIRDPGEFVARHIGEALQGAALVDPGASGPLLDLGSGNGYPGLALCVARPGLVPILAEASEGKAAFLKDLLGRRFPGGKVIGKQVQRPGDLESVAPLRLLVTRAMGGWERIVPRLSPCLAPDGEVLLWAGRDAESVLSRHAWRSLRSTGRTPLEGRDRSWIWTLRP